ncbi:MAG TPA: 50S ribosomal protein L29 [Candidatus Omnitrophota bacterium]|nr:50S ribosomal protein L29 [Candidatus Omnitrophota bacterium]MDD4940441.1 50S ribosomal protein L29 [Candidatus Omnitrophota bacterium]HNQ51383.1 50S ribosomal protein L29 [Candidatus Omnitrophota bacterium]HQO38049.1 50S ribosomal protein L29 [Candidatus Omnitrophota bacterium]HQQ05983.1 50S ribosomal protein L29 [Candidatus Omnitrophota bacterium]
MKMTELEALSKEELQAKILQLKNDLFKLNAGRYTGNVEKPHLFGAIKKDIARIHTILNRKEKKNG